jgi:hypothetical protein
LFAAGADALSVA